MRSFEVKFIVEAHGEPDEIAEYVREAVSSWSGCLEPDHPMQSVVVFGKVAIERVTQLRKRGNGKKAWETRRANEAARAAAVEKGA